MSICSSITNAASNISTSGVAQSLGQVLGVLGAADVAIRLGSGGQAGVLDLPSLLSETAGIPCYSPELGDFIYVTPLQFWANGGKCDGLRDPDREAIEERIREVEERARRRNEIRRDHGVEVPPDYGSEYLRELQEFLERNNIRFTNGFGGAGGSIEFLASGNLSIWFSSASVTFGAAGPVTGDGTWNSRRIGDSWASPFPANPNQVIPISRGDKIVRSMSGWISPNGNQQSSEIYWNLIKGDGRSVGIENNRVFHSQNWYGQSQPYPGTTSAARTTSISGTQANLNFDPTTPSGEQTPGSVGSNGIADSIPINPPPTPDPPEETPCMGGCSCRDISGAQQQRLNNLEKLVKEIHKAVGAQNFISTYTFAPEQNIENAGKKIYQGGFGRAGTIQANNLIDVMNGLIASEYYRLGLHRFPAKVPDSLIPNPNSLAEAVDRDVIDISDLAGFQEWWFKQWNAWSGKWPIEFEVTDDGKKKPVKLWNLEHAIAELYAGNLKIIEDSDQGVQWGLRAATEASKAGNAALKALHILNELVKLTGAITGNETIKVKTTFTPNLDSWQGAGQSTEEMLKSSEQDLIVTDIKDNRTLIGLLLNISYWAQIAGKAVYSTVDTNPATGQPGMPGDAIKAERKKDKQRNSQFEKEWDKWKREIQIPNNNGILTPDAVNPPTPNITEVQRPQS